MHLEAPLQMLRAYRPLDLNAEAWRKAHPGQGHQEWARQARFLQSRGFAAEVVGRLLKEPCE